MSPLTTQISAAEALQRAYLLVHAEALNVLPTPVIPLVDLESVEITARQGIRAVFRFDAEVADMLDRLAADLLAMPSAALVTRVDSYRLRVAIG